LVDLIDESSIAQWMIVQTWVLSLTRDNVSPVAPWMASTSTSGS